MNSSVVRRAILLLGVLLAFFVGRWTAERSPAAKNSSNSPDSRERSATASASSEAAGERDAPNRPTDAAELAKAVARPAGSFAAEEERQRLIEQWAQKDPRGALEFVRTQLRGDRQAQALASILTIWGKTQPEAAWNWVSSEMPTATHHFDTLLEVFGRNSTETAARYAAKFAAQHPESALEVHLAALLGVTYRGDFAGARSLVEGNTSLSPEVRGNLLNFVAGQWARFAPEQASAWVMSLPPSPQRDQALIGLGESWSEVDPAKAATFATKLPDGPTRALAMRQAIGKWVMTDPEAARNWVVQSDRHQDFDQAVASISTDVNLVNREPGRALKWASTIFDDGLRTQSVNAILFNWYPRDPAGATSYIESSSDLTPEQRRHLLQELKGNGS